MNNVTLFDIETAALPLSEIQHLKPEFTAPTNYKDPSKIQASIAEQEAKWLADGALSALTGRVLCVGTIKAGEFQYSDDEDESELLEKICDWFADEIQGGRFLVGFCSRTFDVPFLIRRAFKHKIKVPPCFWEGRFLSSQFIDVADRWACGGREPRDRVSLDNLSKFLGTGEKLGDGKDFAALWVSDRAKALNYLKRDLELTKAAYERLYL